MEIIRKSIDNAEEVNFTPVTPGDWVVQPSLVNQALDELADRVNTISNTTELEFYANLAAFPLSGAIGVIYIAENTGLMYRWDGLSYVALSSVLPTLAQVLAQGNLSGAYDILMNTTQQVQFGNIFQFIRKNAIKNILELHGELGVLTYINGVLTFHIEQDIVVLNSGADSVRLDLTIPRGILSKSYSNNAYTLFLDTAIISSNVTQTFQAASGVIALTSDIPAPQDLESVLTEGNTTGANDIIVDIPQKVRFGVGSDYIDGGAGLLNIRASSILSLLLSSTHTFQVDNDRALFKKNATNVCIILGTSGNGTIVMENNGFQMTHYAPALTAIRSVIWRDLGGTVAYLSDITNAALGTKSGIVAFGSFVGTPRKATITFANPFADNLYSVTVTGEDNRNFTIESKTAAGFTINANSNSPLMGDTFWQAIKSGETI